MTQLVYLCHPFSSGLRAGASPEALYAEMRRRVASSRWLTSLIMQIHDNWVVLNPLAMSDGIEHVHTGAEWLEVDLALLRACDVVVMANGWRESRGCQREYAEAREHAKTIYQVEPNGTLTSIDEGDEQPSG